MERSKDYIEKNHPEVHRSQKKHRVVVLEAWGSILDERVREVIGTMEERIIDVIVADGWQTPW